MSGYETSEREVRLLSMAAEAREEITRLRLENQKLRSANESQRAELRELRSSNLLLLNTVQVDSMAFDLLCGGRRGQLHSVRVQA